MAYTRVKSNEMAEIWSIKQGKDRRLTGHNEFLLSELDLKPAEKYRFQASDGENIDCWILKPQDFDPDSRYPALVDIHGGPRSKFGESFMFEHQLYSSNGYAVIYANIRGSDGYSQVFSDIRGEYGTRDFRDLMEAVDYTLEKYPWIDKDRIGVTGLSYGGFMTNWAITHTDRFSTAISQNGISDWKAFFGTSDIGFHFSPDQLGGDPWSNEQEYELKSPIRYAPEVKTPVMFIHSLHDYRCWIDQSIQFFSVLKYLGKKTKLALSMEGSHVFRSLSRPSIRRRRLEIMIEWFDEHLK